MLGDKSKGFVYELEPKDVNVIKTLKEYALLIYIYIYSRYCVLEIIFTT